MLTLIPTFDGAFGLPVTVFGVRWQDEGALSRRHPAPLKHAPAEGSRNWSSRTDVSSTPHLLSRPRVSFTPVWQPAGVFGKRLVHAGPARTFCAGALFVTVKWPEQPLPPRPVLFWSQNWGFAREVVEPGVFSISSGGLSSLERRLPFASD